MKLGMTGAQSSRVIESVATDHLRTSGQPPPHLGEVAFERRQQRPGVTGPGAILPVRQHGERLLSGMAQKPPDDRLGREPPQRYVGVNVRFRYSDCAMPPVRFRPSSADPTAVLPSAPNGVWQRRPA